MHCEFVSLVLISLLENFYCGNGDDKFYPMIAEMSQYNGVVQFFRKLDFDFNTYRPLHTIPLSKIHSFSTSGHS